MKKSIFVFLSVFITAMLFATASFAYETYTLTLEDAVEMAKKDNPRIISADTKIKDAEKQKADAQKDQREQKGFIRLPDAFMLVPVKQGYYVEQGTVNIESAKREKVQAVSNLEYEVTQKYYSVKLAEALVNSSNNAYKMAQENKNVIDSQFKLGLVSQLDVNNAEYSVSQAKATADKYLRDYDIARRSLLISLQIYDTDTELVLTDNINYEAFSSDVDTDIEKAMKTRYDVFSIESALSLALKYRDITLVLGSASAEYSAANQSVVQCEYTCKNSKNLIGLGIRKSYNDVLNAADGVLLAEKNLSLKSQEYEVAKVQYELGMITNIQLTAALNAVTMAEIEFENSKLTHKLAVIGYGYEITIGL